MISPSKNASFRVFTWDLVTAIQFVPLVATSGSILEKFFWKRVAQDVKEFVSRCDNCQKVNPVPRQDVAELHPVPVPSGIMVQIGVGITNFPKTDDGYCCAVVAMDCFSKWPEAHVL